MSFRTKDRGRYTGRPSAGARACWLLAGVVLLAIVAVACFGFDPVVSGVSVAGAVAVLFVLASILAFGFYARDKRAAVAGRWRTPESTLLMLGLVGGWPGALAAQHVLRHKNRKGSFQASFWLTVVLNVAALGALLLLT